MQFSATVTSYILKIFLHREIYALDVFCKVNVVRIFGSNVALNTGLYPTQQSFDNTAGNLFLYTTMRFFFVTILISQSILGLGAVMVAYITPLRHLLFD